jgi:two-component system chemotaxis sensor kinase CheA
MNDVDHEIFIAFVEEGLEMIDDVEPQLVALETTQDAAGKVDPEMVNSIFRLFHSLKGSAGFLELSNIVELTHRAENLLDIFRRELAILDGPDISLLLQTIDLLRKVMNDLAETGRDDTFRAEVVRQVDSLQASLTLKQNAAAAAVAVPAPADAALEITITTEMSARFLEEAEDLLDAAEQNLLQAMADEEQNTDLSVALRSMHSFKGNSGFMGYLDLEDLMHGIESVLEKVVQGVIPAEPDALALFLEVVDAARRAVADLGAGGTGHMPVLTELLEALDRMIRPATKVARPQPPPPVSVPAADADAAPRKGFIPLANMKNRSAGAGAAAATAAGRPSLPPVPIYAPAAATGPSAVARAAAGAGNRAVEGRSGEPAKAKAGGSIRVDLAKLDTLMNLVGELVIAETMVTRNPDLKGHEFENLEKASHHLRRITTDLQDVAMSVRMVPLTGTFKKMVRLVHDTALKSGKRVDLRLKGEETEIDKTVIESIADPLVHIVRNAIDHGIEKPEVRRSMGKPPEGTVTIEARHESGEVWIIVSDDGQGLAREAILAKAIGKGLVEDDGSSLSDMDIYRLVFAPGFSTATEITELSGRGVGMDVVKQNIESINGRVDIRSTPGRGSSFIMRIPLTMAIIEGMLVRVGRSTYSVPLLSIREAFQPQAGQVTVTPDGIEVVRLREELIPVVRMHELYRLRGDCEELTDGIVIIVENDGTTAALFADEILGQQQTVVKGLSSYVGKPHGVSGCTILGDGSISLILDVATILAHAATAPTPKTI